MSECPTCSREFETNTGMKIHHKSEHGESISGFQKECKNCGDTFTAPQRSREYCEQACVGKDLFNGSGNPSWKGGCFPEIECQQCGTSFEVHRSKKDTKKYCSKDCFGKAHKGRLAGENNPHWKGGWEGYYGPDWEKQRQKALERDNYQCRACGITQPNHRDKYGTGLNVHHIVPHRRFESNEAANDIGNLVTACRSCHSRYEGLPVFPV